MATIGDQSVHLCLRLGRQPAPQRIIHAHIEPAEQPQPHGGTPDTKYPRQDKTPAPDGPVAAKPYISLRKALERSSNVAVAKLAFHGRERLGLLRIKEDATSCTR
ncbi:hypothetical protein [Streptomyces sp. NPDC000410]|uniref:hypothetical protein n=1 Tax=Streptomyces sp. NPDC000410 TaxID=3154254 RepID=UPI003317600C